MLTTQEVSRMCGLTPRQLQWWHETGVVKVQVNGHRRNWEDGEARTVKVLAALRKKGVPVHRLRTLAQSVRRIVQMRNKPLYLVTDGSAAWAGDAGHVLTAATRSARAVWLLKVQ